MPNCKEHEDCDLVCIECGDYYCRGEHDKYKPSVITLYRHVPRYERRYETMRQAHEAAVFDDMPDDIDEYYNERAEERA